MTEFTLQDDRITEPSSLVASVKHPGTFMTSNDEPGHLFWVRGSDGKTVSTVDVPFDMDDPEGLAEDLAGTVWWGDIGNNDDNPDRDFISVFAFPEPGLRLGQKVKATRYDFTYPGGARNAECLLAWQGAAPNHIISKEAASKLYRFPNTLKPHTKGKNRLILVDSSMGAWVSDGDISVDGLWLFTVRKDEPTTCFVHRTSDWAFQGEIPMPEQEKPEGLTTDPDGLHLWVISDKGSPGATAVRFNITATWQSAGGWDGPGIDDIFGPTGPSPWRPCG